MPSNISTLSSWAPVSPASVPAIICRRNVPASATSILEGRSGIGGTWDLFRYPGIRSDSDMFTMGFSFKGWKETRAVGDGAAILNYLRETAQEFGIDRQIRYQTASNRLPGPRMTRCGPSRRKSARKTSPSNASVSRVASYYCAAAITTTTTVTRPYSRGVPTFRDRLSIPSIGLRILTIGTNGWS